ncbi:hypothetical protein ACIRQY_26565 [Streptomyces sp. NPDC101490]
MTSPGDTEVRVALALALERRAAKEFRAFRPRLRRGRLKGLLMCAA